MAKTSVELPPWEIIAEPVAPDAAIDFWRNRAKLTWPEAKALAEGAKARAFYVTGLYQQDLVKLVSDGIQAALENGETLPQFKERILAAIQSQGWHSHRVENIFRTNMQTAYSAGRYKKMQAVKSSRPYWQYMAVMDRRVRPSHAILHGKVYPADHEFWDSNYPPNGFRCRCGVITLSERQVKAQGLTVENDMPQPGVWTDPKTGMEYFVNFPGADKGFGNNPFKEWVCGKLTPDLKEKQPPPGWDYEKARRAAAEPDEIEKAVGVKKGAPIGWNEAAGNANPHFQKGREYQINCQRCVPTFELRRRGYPVEAMPNHSAQPNRSGIINGNECYKNAVIKGIYGKTPKLTKADLLNELKTFPDGARFGIIWMWPGRRSAHTVACEKSNGKLVFMDPQTGVVGPTALGKADRATGYSYYRMDDKELADAFQWDDIVKAART